jgi:hypothetical protein
MSFKKGQDTPLVPPFYGRQAHKSDHKRGGGKEGYQKSILSSGTYMYMHFVERNLYC